jgi:hypothetical protein
MEDGTLTQVEDKRKDYVLPMEENRIISDPAAFSAASDGEGSAEEDVIGAITEEAETLGGGELEIESHEGVRRSERDEYDALIKNRFKELYAEDTQRLINRRFRKYKVMEERFKTLEETWAQKEAQISENMQKIAEFASILRYEVEKAIKETEERVISEVRSKRLRPTENGASPRKGAVPFDVSRLTKSERASLAKRAAGGEKIKF